MKVEIIKVEEGWKLIHTKGNTTHSYVFEEWPHLIDAINVINDEEGI